ncbi:MAG: hypothetical protein ACYDC3_14270 [Candidatus Binataceae bacterium]
MSPVVKVSRSVFALLHLTGCVVALGMAIILPALHTQNFGPSYKPIEVRQAAARHEYLGICEDRTDAGVESLAAFSGPAPLSLLDPMPSAARAWFVATLLIPKPTGLRHFRRLIVSSDPCGPPFALARA